MPSQNHNISKLARAKINLTLHVSPSDANGYHPLHSIVAFADMGDQLSAVKADKFSLQIDGPFANGLPQGAGNLVLKAALAGELVSDMHSKSAYKLTKYLPVSSGIGGGSADAAAALRLLAILNAQPPTVFEAILSKIGADVPVCYCSQTCLMKGYGGDITPLEHLGQVAAILVNPNIPISTRQIFKLFDAKGKSSDFAVPKGSLLEMAMAGHNDLQAPAIYLAPVIQTIIDEITNQNGCELARMSGSGSTCFGLFNSVDNAKIAVGNIQEKYPNWWCTPTLLGDSS